jgi:hypothetical protein
MPEDFDFIVVGGGLSSSEKSALKIAADGTAP